MKDYLDNVKNELKRVDHIVYVSLKYTRTVDVIKHAVDRMISSFDFGIEAILQKTKKRKKTLEIPEQPLKRCELVRELFSEDEKMMEYVNFYLLLKALARSEYTKKEEYRRNVAMIVRMESGMIEVNIDLLYVYEQKMREFVSYLEEFLGLAEERL